MSKQKIKKQLKQKDKTYSVSRTFLKKGGLKQNPSVPTKVGTASFEKGSSLETLEEKMEEILKILRERSWTIGVMESCTGGAVANCTTNIPGSSDVFGEGKVTYCNEAKIKAGVDKEIIEKFGVFSREVAEEMARKAIGDLGVGVTGNLPGVVYVSVRVEEKVESIKLKVESKNKNKIEARKEMKEQVVERVVEMINDNL